MISRTLRIFTLSGFSGAYNLKYFQRVVMVGWCGVQGLEIILILGAASVISAVITGILLFVSSTTAPIFAFGLVVFLVGAALSKEWKGVYVGSRKKSQAAQHRKKNRWIHYWVQKEIKRFRRKFIKTPSSRPFPDSFSPSTRGFWFQMLNKGTRTRWWTFTKDSNV